MSTCFSPDGHGQRLASSPDAYYTTVAALPWPSLGVRFAMPSLAPHYTGAAGR